MRLRAKESIGISCLDYTAGIEHDDLIVVKDSFEFVGDRYDGVSGELFADDSLHYFIGLSIDTGPRIVSKSRKIHMVQ